MWAKRRGLAGAISRPSDYTGESNLLLTARQLASEVPKSPMWKLHVGNPLTFLGTADVYASFPCSSATRQQAHGRCVAYAMQTQLSHRSSLYR